MAACTNDEIVLNVIFNPNLPLTENCKDQENVEKQHEDRQIDPQILNQVKELEIEGVKEAEAGNLEKSLQIFNNAINLAPSYAATFNNRAQLHRMKGDVSSAKEDLERAIELSNGHGKTAAQALTQRALLRKTEGDDEGSLEDFKKAAHLGNAFAKSQVVKMNPYAAMCNQMLSQAFGALRGTEEKGK
eukprot:gene15251-16826_t